MTTKSTITVTDDGTHMKIEVSHDPIPSGPVETWHGPAKTTEMMMTMFHLNAEASGLLPIIDARKNWDTGETFITRRDKQEGDRT